MKKVICLLLCGLFVLFCGCKSEAVTACENLISEIGTVSLESESSIKVAEEAYANLPEDEKSDVDNYATLVEARDTYNVALFDSMVAELSDAELLKQKDIDAAYAVYDELSESAKTKTNQYAALEKLDKNLTKLEKYALEAANAVKDTMKDENSFVITAISIKEGNFATPYAVLIEYNAENSFGATIDGLDCVDITSSGDVGLWALGLLTVGQERATTNVYLDYIGFDSEEIFFDADRIMKHLD